MSGHKPRTSKLTFEQLLHLLADQDHLTEAERRELSAKIWATPAAAGPPTPDEEPQDAA